MGCVIVNAQEIIAQGYTQSPGKHHAEAEALSQIQGKVFNFVDSKLWKMYVTLEPCSFQGHSKRSRKTSSFGTMCNRSESLPLPISFQINMSPSKN